jgi:adenylate cyclase
MSPVRRLAAILAADVAGYSRLMEADEARAAQNPSRRAGQSEGRRTPASHRKEHRRRFLAEFASVVDAVRCAVEIQRGMAERNAETAEDQRIAFRVGINLAT